ncbi:hypothetical protein C1J03_23895 (plasmid) [Sulfitobacter sp. SK012]|uniref:hypothetical protein n=1 Tax=Sulfitobacter sp. SK012 TaxID=1389005 RepID=UPI000E0B9A03|nr:hypothetical protein [Sulfitobacter sp. SK012]AXI49154.1 hypothetical protein C1J03_23895 [Sulfitobacter sp. SK012]
MEQISKNPDTQNDKIGFLSSAKEHLGGGPVEVVQTHGAVIFLAGNLALNIKRAGRYDDIDLSPPEPALVLIGGLSGNSKTTVVRTKALI